MEILDTTGGQICGQEHRFRGSQSLFGVERRVEGCEAGTESGSQALRGLVCHGEDS